MKQYNPLIKEEKLGREKHKKKVCTE